MRFFVKWKRWNCLLLCMFLLGVSGWGQNLKLLSPNQKLSVELCPQSQGGCGQWYLRVRYRPQQTEADTLLRIKLGLLRNDQLFADKLKLRSHTKVVPVYEKYTALTGKRLLRTNQANELTVSFTNPDRSVLNLIIRAYNDGVAFRYEFPEKHGVYTMLDELTAYSIPDSTTAWLEKFNPANEGLYTCMKKKYRQGDWAYPALFNRDDCWILIHEADLSGSYCATKLSNTAEAEVYKLTFPDQWNGRGKGNSQPSITLPWKSPWRVLIIGSLADIVSSTLVDDVSTPSVLTQTDWIKPGVASWNYWSDNHGTKDYKEVCRFADLAATMGWRYTLLDWEWDAMGNGGNLEDAVRYIHSKGVHPLIWYNSGGNHTWVEATPKDRMLTHENRMAEFEKLSRLGIGGVKIDFFESEKQDMIQYYIDILNDAARAKMMVYFHGCLVPRGWQRTYPNLMTYEGVRGAEWYNNGPEFSTTAPEHNAILPFTRNVVGSMDYTPVTFTNSQYPHTTSYAHELALSVLFESGIQHFADRPEGYLLLPEPVLSFLKQVPVAWDDTRLLTGYPGKELVLARQKGNRWFVAGINAENIEKNSTCSLEFLPPNVRYKLTLLADGGHDKDFSIRYDVVDCHSTIQIKMLRRGGFAALLETMD